MPFQLLNQWSSILGLPHPAKLACLWPSSLYPGQPHPEKQVDRLYPAAQPCQRHASIWADNYHPALEAWNPSLPMAFLSLGTRDLLSPLKVRQGCSPREDSRASQASQPGPLNSCWLVSAQELSLHCLKPLLLLSPPPSLSPKEGKVTASMFPTPSLPLEWKALLLKASGLSEFSLLVPDARDKCRAAEGGRRRPAIWPSDGTPTSYYCKSTIWLSGHDLAKTGLHDVPLASY